MNKLIYQLEDRLSVGPVRTARFLGYSYSTYAQYKNGHRKLKQYSINHLRAVLSLSQDQLIELLQEIEQDART